MATYYVAKTGSDAAAGTLAAPWLTIQKAINTATSPGDYVWIRAGTYTEHLAIGTAGTAGNYIHFMAYRGEKVIVDGGSTYALRDTGGHAYIYLQGLEFRSTDTVDYAIGLDTYPAGGSDHWVISGCRITGKVYLIGNYTTFSGNAMNGANGFDNAVRDLLSVSHHNKFIGNYIVNYTIRAFWSTNVSHNDDWWSNKTVNCFNGIDADGYGTVEYEHTIKRNWIESATEVGIQMENCFNCDVSSNYLKNCVAGIEWILYGPTNDPGPQTRVTSAGGYGDLDSNNNVEGDNSQANIANNIIDNCDSGIVIYQSGNVAMYNNTLDSSLRGIWLNSISPSAIMRNNILTRGTILANSLSNFSADDHNLFAANPSYDNGTTTYTLAQQVTNNGQGSGSLVAAPLLTAFVPSASSPAVNAGSSTGAPAKDYRGVTRPLGGTYDIGAYEVG